MGLPRQNPGTSRVPWGPAEPQAGPELGLGAWSGIREAPIMANPMEDPPSPCLNACRSGAGSAVLALSPLCCCLQREGFPHLCSEEGPLPPAPNPSPRETPAAGKHPQRGRPAEAAHAAHLVPGRGVALKGRCTEPKEPTPLPLLPRTRAGKHKGAGGRRDGGSWARPPLGQEQTGTAARHTHFAGLDNDDPGVLVVLFLLLLFGVNAVELEL